MREVFGPHAVVSVRAIGLREGLLGMGGIAAVGCCLVALDVPYEHGLYEALEAGKIGICDPGALELTANPAPPMPRAQATIERLKAEIAQWKQSGEASASAYLKQVNRLGSEVDRARDRRDEARAERDELTAALIRAEGELIEAADRILELEGERGPACLPHAPDAGPGGEPDDSPGAAEERAQATLNLEQVDEALRGIIELGKDGAVEQLQRSLALAAHDSQELTEIYTVLERELGRPVEDAEDVEAAFVDARAALDGQIGESLEDCEPGTFGAKLLETAQDRAGHLVVDGPHQAGCEAVRVISRDVSLKFVIGGHHSLRVWIDGQGRIQANPADHTILVADLQAGREARVAVSQADRIASHPAKFVSGELGPIEQPADCGAGSPMVETVASLAKTVVEATRQLREAKIAAAPYAGDDRGVEL